MVNTAKEKEKAAMEKRGRVNSSRSTGLNRVNTINSINRTSNVLNNRVNSMSNVKKNNVVNSVKKDSSEKKDTDKKPAPKRSLFHKKDQKMNL